MQADNGSEVHRVYRRALSVSEFSVFVSLRRRPCRRLAAWARNIDVGMTMPPSAPAAIVAVG